MELTFNLTLNYHVFQEKTLLKLFSKEYNTIVLEKFGYSESKMTKVDSSYKANVKAHWKQYMSILIKGKNRLHISLSTDQSGQIHGGGGITVSIKNLNSALEDLMQIFNILNDSGALIFASLDSREIYDQRHKVVTRFESGGSSYGWEGSSMWAFQDYLPGISWFNFFGEDYVNAIGKSNLSDLEGIVYGKSKNEAIAFYSNKNMVDTSLMDLEAIESQIGENYFFSKERVIENLHHPIQFSQFLKSLEEKFIEKYP
ncbi:MAG: hypothetical protein GQ574_07160 [Crocinitomix sp.]|nr:hypothetical protein [Crocinitomix sp.]